MKINKIIYLLVICVLIFAATNTWGGTYIKNDNKSVLENPEIMSFEENTVELHGKPSQIRIVEYSDSSNGKVVWFAKGQLGWIFQWAWDNSKFFDGIKYSIYLKVKKATKKPAVYSIMGGVFGRITMNHGSTLFSFDYDVAKKISNEWVYILVGKDIDMHKTYGYVYLKTNRTPILIDAVYAVPQINNENREQYNKHRVNKKQLEAAQRKEMQDIKAGLNDFPELKNKFLYGTVMAKESFRWIAKTTGVPWEWEFRQSLHDLKRNYCNFNYQLSLDATSSEMYLTAKIMEEERIYSVNGDVKIIPSIFSVKDKVKPAVLKKFFGSNAPKYEKFSYFLAWSLADEPLPGKLYDYIVGKGIIESIDKKRPAIPILNTGEVIELYGPYQQVIVSDYYTLKRSNPDPWAVGDRAGFCQKVGKYRKPVWVLYGTYSSVGIRMSTPAEVRIMIYQALLNNVTSLSNYIFNYISYIGEAAQTHLDLATSVLRYASPTWREIGNVGRKLVPVGALMAQAKYLRREGLNISSHQITAAGKKRPAFEGAVWQLNDARLLLLVNNDIAKAGKVKVSLQKMRPDDRILNLYTLEKVDKNEEINLIPGDGCWFAIGNEKSLQVIEDAIYKTRLEQEKAILELDIALLKKYKVDISAFDSELKTMKTGGNQAVEIEKLRNKIYDKLERAGKFISNKKALDDLSKLLNEIENILEKAKFSGKEVIDLAETKEFFALLKRFGKLRYSIYENQPFRTNEIKLIVNAAIELKNKLEKVFP